MLSEKSVELKGKKLKQVKFAKSPIMSTYLVAFTVGEFEFIETTANPTAPAGAQPIPVRVYTPPGKIDPDFISDKHYIISEIQL